MRARGGLRRIRAEPTVHCRITIQLIPPVNSLEHGRSDMAVRTHFTCTNEVDNRLWYRVFKLP